MDTNSDRLPPDAGTFSREEYLELWRYFEGVGNQAKSQMTASAGWLLAIAGAALSAAIGSLEFPLCSRNPQQGFAYGLAGALVCCVCLAMIREFQSHTYRNWWRATRCKLEVKGLHKLVTAQDKLEPVALTPDAFKAGDKRVASIFRIYQWAALGGLVLLGLIAILPAIKVVPGCPIANSATPGGR